MGHDEDKNNFGGGNPNLGRPVTPVVPATTATTPNPRAQAIVNNRLGLRPARNLSAQEELDRISGVDHQSQPAGGDIILAPEKKRGSKKFLIIGLVTVLIIAAVVAGIVLLSRGGNFLGGVSYKKELDDFSEWLLNGDGSVRVSSEKSESKTTLADFTDKDDELIYPLNFYTLSSYIYEEDEDIARYFSELYLRYDKLKKKIGNSNKKSEVEELGVFIEILENNVNYTKIRKTLASEYRNSTESAREYYRKRFEKDLSDDMFQTILDMQADLYDYSLNEDLVYMEANCYDPVKGPIYECIISNNNYDYFNRAEEESSKVLSSFRMISSLNTEKRISEKIISLLKEMGE